MFLDTEALPLLLSHPSVVQQQQAVCSLLCTSKDLANAVLEHCSGQVLISLTLPSHHEDRQHTQQRLQQFVAWLARHAVLLKDIRLNLYPPLQLVPRKSQAAYTTHDDKAEAELAVAAAIQHASAAGKLKALQTFKLINGRTSAVCILQQLPPNSLTSLHLELSRLNSHLREFECITTKLPKVSTVTPALARFTALQHLWLVSPEAQQLLPALPALRQLKQLGITYLAAPCVPQLGHALAAARQLQQLQFNVLEEYEVYYDQKEDEEEEGGSSAVAAVGAATAAAGSNAAGVVAGPVEVQQYQHQQVAQQLVPSLQLGQLTALTTIKGHTYRLQAADVLPTGLQVLELGCCCSIKPLLQLQQLQRLHIHKDPPPTAEELQQLSSSLKHLRSLGLNYQQLTTAAAAAAVWPQLPLASLELELDDSSSSGVMPVTMLQQLGRLQGLTRLSITGACSAARIEATPEEFGGLLQQLEKLRELELHSLKVHPPQQQLQEVKVEQQQQQQQDAREGQERAVAAAVAAAAAPIELTAGAAAGAAARAARRAALASRAKSGAQGTAEMAGLVAAIASLPQLVSLTLSDLKKVNNSWLGPGDLLPLAAATQLTCLHVFMSRIEDAAVASIARSLTGLQRLSLDHCFLVGDAAAAVIAGELQQLRWLSLWGTRVMARQLLEQQLQQLETLVMPSGI